MCFCDNKAWTLQSQEVKFIRSETEKCELDPSLIYLSDSEVKLVACSLHLHIEQETL